MAIREGRWDCPSCGSTRIYGRHVECPGCGKPRPAGVRFYLTDDAPAITDQAQLAEARAGADWICLHCDASNRATLEDCGGCGAARGSSPAQPVIDYASGEVPRSGEGSAAPTPPGTASSPATPGWICNHCQAQCPMQTLTCPTCGNLRGSRPAKPDPWQQPAAGKIRPLVGRSPAPAAPSPAAAAAATAAAATGQGRMMNRVVGGVIGGLALLMGFFVIAGSQSRDPVSLYQPEVVPYPVPAVVLGKRWERSVDAQLRRLVPDSGFAMPDGALMLTSEQRLTGHERFVERYEVRTRQEPRRVAIEDGWEWTTREVEEEVRVGSRTYVCGQRDLGNGYFEDRECTEPEYETRTRTERVREPRYRYETRTETVTERTPVYATRPVHRTWYTWNLPVTTDTTLVVVGDTTEPAWPNVQEGPNASLRDKRESYYLIVRPEGRDWMQVEVSREDWERYRQGDPVAVRLRGYDRDLLPADSLPACIRWNGGQGTPPSESLGCSGPVRDSAAAVPPDSTAPDSASGS